MPKCRNTARSYSWRCGSGDRDAGCADGSSTVSGREEWKTDEVRWRFDKWMGGVCGIRHCWWIFQLHKVERVLSVLVTGRANFYVVETECPILSLGPWRHRSVGPTGNSCKRNDIAHDINIENSMFGFKLTIQRF